MRLPARATKASWSSVRRSRRTAAELGRRWATPATPSIRRVPAEPGVTARLYADLRRSGEDL
ncbi:DUF6207 family protein [Streptomyces sp. NBC_01276]|uniref:DUF6207 family protein n=1 Tax=Streptomyces sp. NBC_01276 TaxID=2903808 RepID=UPI00352C29B6